MEAEAVKIEQAVRDAISEGARTRDLLLANDTKKPLNTKEITEIILQKLD